MYDLPVIKLPNELTTLMKLRLHNHAQSYSYVIEVLSKNNSLMAIIANAFTEFSEQGKILEIINILGWKHFRDRLLSIYIYKSVFARYPDSTDTLLISDLSDCEEMISSFTPNSSSRALLFVFYLKYFEYLKRDEGEGEIIKLNEIFEKVFDVLSLGDGKTHQIDWLAFSIWHFSEYYGIEDLEEKLNNKMSFNQLYEELSENNKNQFINNSLSYACSINEDECFFSEKV